MFVKWLVCSGLTVCLLRAQTPAAPDVVVFADGEKLVGQFERSGGATFLFRSDMVGEITVPWNKVQEFQSSKTLAVIPRGVRLRRKDGISGVVQGAFAVAGPNLTVTPAGGAAQTVPIADVDHVLEEPVFMKAMEQAPGFFSDWGGTITVGASLVEATQESRTFTGAISLVRLDPDEDWLTRRNRTLVNFTESYGTISQPGTAEVKTSLFHAGLERDEYLSPAWFAFGQVLLDHNYSQGLALQQTWGGGIGWSALKRPTESLDFKAAMTYINQDFAHSESAKNLVASAFEEDFRRNLPRGTIFSEQLIATPAWNNSTAYSATGNALLTIPVVRRISSSVGLFDSFLHDPPPGFKKNSLQVTFGLTYALK